VTTKIEYQRVAQQSRNPNYNERNGYSKTFPDLVLYVVSAMSARAQSEKLLGLYKQTALTFLNSIPRFNGIGSNQVTHIVKPYCL